MPRDSLKPIDILRHELKALRFILDNFHSGKLGADGLPPREDFQSAQGRALYDSIVKAPDRKSAEATIAEPAEAAAISAADPDAVATLIASIKRRAIRNLLLDLDYKTGACTQIDFDGVSFGTAVPRQFTPPAHR